jgi:predicted AAA+ superfamily ATPase
MTFLQLHARVAVMKRSIQTSIIEDLNSKIVLLSGPRQVGKTTLSKQLYPNYEYLNFDNSEDRKSIMEKSWKRSSELVIFSV